MNKTVVVTGGTKGIGKAINELFAQKGFKIFTCARNENDLKDLKNNLEKKYSGCSLHYLPADMSNKEDVKKFSKYVLDEVGDSLDVLINNAGLFIPGTVAEEEEGALEKMIETNLYSAYHLTRALLSSVKKAKGHIFSICSTASIIPYMNGGSYCISKFAMLGMTKVLREELKTEDVRVTAVLPGATYTASWDGVELPEERFMKPEDVASSVMNAYEVSDRTVIEEIILRPQLGDI